MNLEEIKRLYFKTTLKLDLPPEEVLVGGGSLCVYLGLREETNDLDLYVNDANFKLLEKRFPAETLSDGVTKKLIISRKVKIFLIKYEKGFSDDEEIYFIKPETLLRQKLQWNREKDKEVIAGLRALTKKEKVTGKICVGSEIFIEIEKPTKNKSGFSLVLGEILDINKDGVLLFRTKSGFGIATEVKNLIYKDRLNENAQAIAVRYSTKNDMLNHYGSTGCFMRSIGFGHIKV